MVKKTITVDKCGKISKLAENKISDLTYSILMKAFRKKDVKVNGKRVSQDVVVDVGDVVEIFYVPTVNVKYKTLYVDANLVVIYKERGYESVSVYETLLAEYPTAKFIHRLDTNTDGVMVFAINERAEKELLEGFKSRAFEKIYQAKVKGFPKTKSAILCAYLVKDESQSHVKIFDNPVKNSVPIKTEYKLIKEEGDCSLLEVKLHTGKTHQIRAHLAHVGLPILGDGKYGDFEFNKKKGVERQMLTAVSIKFHFVKGSLLEYLDGKLFSIV
jgi:23S rRNA pseudouridine955/2504/2580 synthase